MPVRHVDFAPGALRESRGEKCNYSPRDHMENICSYRSIFKRGSDRVEPASHQCPKFFLQIWEALNCSVVAREPPSSLTMSSNSATSEFALEEASSDSPRTNDARRAVTSAGASPVRVCCWCSWRTARARQARSLRSSGASLACCCCSWRYFSALKRAASAA